MRLHRKALIPAITGNGTAMLRVGNALPRAVLKRMGFLRRNNAPALTGAGSCMLCIAEQRQRVQKDMVSIKVSFVSAQTEFMAGVALRVKIPPRFLGRALMLDVLIPAVPAGAGKQPLVAGGIVRALVGRHAPWSSGNGRRIHTRCIRRRSRSWSCGAAWQNRSASFRR